MLQTIYLVLNALLWVAVAASAVMWIGLVRNHWKQRPASFLETTLPARSRDRPFWTAFDALIMLGAWMVVDSLSRGWMIAQGWIEMTPPGDESKPVSVNSLLASTAATSIAGLSAVVITLLWLRLFDPDPRRRLGLTLSASDVRLGLKSALMILPPVMLVGALVDFVIPYNHPVLESLKQISTPRVFAAIFFGTAVVTPLFEELLVRVLLQGGLQGLADRENEQTASWRPRAYWPIVVSSVIFAMLHLGQGGGPIPLFLFSLGLGYLYRQTGCIAAPMIVHMVLNSVTLVVEVVKLQFETP